MVKRSGLNESPGISLSWYWLALFQELDSHGLAPYWFSIASCLLQWILLVLDSSCTFWGMRVSRNRVHCWMLSCSLVGWHCWSLADLCIHSSPSFLLFVLESWLIPFPGGYTICLWWLMLGSWRLLADMQLACNSWGSRFLLSYGVSWWFPLLAILESVLDPVLFVSLLLPRVYGGYWTAWSRSWGVCLVLVTSSWLLWLCWPWVLQLWSPSIPSGWYPWVPLVGSLSIGHPHDGWSLAPGCSPRISSLSNVWWFLNLDGLLS